MKKVRSAQQFNDAIPQARALGIYLTKLGKARGVPATAHSPNLSGQPKTGRISGDACPDVVAGGQ
ncbi:hypothetical protein [Pontibaca salina]|uniref:Uncharacterized protein n=1 Tax=Pontibaca salina TaxID=2795731 RepID=A0A934M2A1_9RHOB|nr:hypothetical protein [Pontibaca salina]MBI6628604.1 hypothetical protein [Pontibaca salina]